jgi:uncharacterized protein
MDQRSCTRCGACCVAPDIRSLGKAMGVPCVHLADDLSCRIYENRPAICASYAADALCDRIERPTLAARVAAYLEEFGFLPESKQRHLPVFPPQK